MFSQSTVACSCCFIWFLFKSLLLREKKHNKYQTVVLSIPLVLEDRNNGWGAAYLNFPE